MFDVLLAAAIKKPELVIVVHDLVPGPSPFSRPSSRKVSAAVAEQPSIWGVGRRVQALLVPKGDRVTGSVRINEFRRVTVDGVDRCYVMVSGDNFSFGKRLGRDFFNPGSAAAKFSPADVPIVEEMVKKFLDELRLK